MARPSSAATCSELDAVSAFCMRMRMFSSASNVRRCWRTAKPLSASALADCDIGASMCCRSSAKILRVSACALARLLLPELGLSNSDIVVGIGPDGVLAVFAFTCVVLILKRRLCLGIKLCGQSLVSTQEHTPTDGRLRQTFHWALSGEEAGTTLCTRHI
ncbi:hypercellular protein [Grosmannia clavigera kw1407]|uniref:Hypercellular protein n=1 Tax=Grosmannia clavigera (strain kw1407 / UAMH 11150) TaxID=655863 RepID=F0XBZ6_GROCL|nr:hypercellular protein [Grosmannia clavigera kw1407]EFX04033.1 hypercellular protein [Grosmannia clavigera kw1407]